MKKLLSVLFAGILFCSALVSAPALVGSAAGSTVLGVSNKTPNVGESITITVTIKADESMYATEGDLSFDSSILQFEGGGSASLVDGKVKLIGTPGGANSQTFSLTFKALAAGQSTVSLGNAKYVGSNSIDVAGSSFRLTVNAPSAPDPAAPAASSDASLTSLKVSDGTLSPAFNPAVTSYKVTVDNKITKTTVTAAPASGAKVSGAGTVKLSIGDNKRNITVTAADGKTKKTYTVIIHRLADGENDSAAAEPPATPAQTEDALAVTVDGKAYHISASLESLSLPAGFTAGTSSYSGNPVPVYEDGKSEYTLYGLTYDADGTIDFYTYNAVENKFEKVVYAYLSNRFYIFPGMEKNTAAPDGFFDKKVEISGALVDSYAFDDASLADFYVVYCYTDGKYGYYRYDSIEETLQRYPEFKPANAEQINADAEDKEPKGFFGRFSSLSTKARVTVFALAVVAVCLVALIILLILKIVADRNSEKEGFLDDSAFDYGLDDAIPFDSVKEFSDGEDEPDSDDNDGDDGENN